MTRRARSLRLRRHGISACVLVSLLAMLARLPAGAQTFLPPDPSKTVGGTVSFEGFIDENGRDVPSLLREADRAEAARPWIVSPIYTRCPRTCSPITSGLRAALERSGLQPSAYRVVSFSFDPEETADGLRAFRTRMQLPQGWLTLRAAEPAALERTLKSLDFRTIKMADRQYDHPNLLAVLAPDMRLTEYVFGVAFSPTQLAAAVRRARAGGSWRAGRQSDVFTFAGIGLLVSAFAFSALLLRRRGSR